MADGRERVTAFMYWYVGPLDRGVPIREATTEPTRPPAPSTT